MVVAIVIDGASSPGDEADAVARLVSQNAFFLTSDFENKQQQLGVNIRDYLWRHWQTIFSLNSNEKDEESANSSLEKTQELWFERIYTHYGESGRYYHTPVHLYEMLEYLSSVGGLTGNSDSSTQKALLLATFFHDVIYNPQSSTNEKDSANLFVEFSKDTRLDATMTAIVQTLILATEKHKIIESDNDHKVQLQKLFLDVDMAVLGKQSHAYLSYAAAIRNEYSFVPHDVYCTKRAEILKLFLEHDAIYLSPQFHSLLEQQARDNLKMEIEILERGEIPGEKVSKDEQEA